MKEFNEIVREYEKKEAEKREKAVDNLTSLFAQLFIWFLSAWFIFKGYGVARGLFTSLPVLTYWQIFWLRMGVSSTMKIFWQK